ncbi:ABC transporter ATP-binding protein [Actinokineospora pegani]|uniref:ABC transporter ATP-binding protein n=1 Tax=Actinokineospora pegani TaxID=2654637 RepID=UPI0012E9EEFA|nr:ABC transporter ATP-binding protein [Actinokineospora pegani]
MTTVVQVEDLGKRYRRTQALSGCAFELPEGSVTALVGPNGAGKSTLLSLIAGLALPTSGRVRVYGAQVLGRTPPQVSLLAQGRPMVRGLTVAETMRMGAALNPHWSQRRADEVLDLLSPVDRDKKVGELSAGTRTQVALAFCLGRLPRLVLLDEPLADLDPLARDEALRVLMTDVAERGTTAIISSHLLTDLNDVCDHLLLLDKGRVQLCGEIDDVLADHSVLTGPADSEVDAHVVSASHTERQTTMLARGPATAPAGWLRADADLETLVKGYLRASRDKR